MLDLALGREPDLDIEMIGGQRNAVNKAGKHDYTPRLDPILNSAVHRSAAVSVEAVVQPVRDDYIEGLIRGKVLNVGS